MSNKAKQTSIAAFFGGGGAKPAPAQAQGEGATGKRKLDAETAAPPVKKENVAEGDVAAIFKKPKRLQKKSEALKETEEEANGGGADGEVSAMAVEASEDEKPPAPVESKAMTSSNELVLKDAKMKDERAPDKPKREVPDAAGGAEPRRTSAKEAAKKEKDFHDDNLDDVEEEDVDEDDNDVDVDSDDDAENIDENGAGEIDNALAAMMRKENKDGNKTAKKAKKSTKETANTTGVGERSVEAAARLKAYDPHAIASWKTGESVPYLFIASKFEEIAETTKRLEIAELLTNAFRTIIATTPEDLLPAVYLASNTLAPQHEGVDLGIGDATLIKALAEATGRKEAAIKADYKTEGDLGVVAMASRSTQKTMFQPPKLTCSGVLAEFRAIAKTEGSKSMDVKKGKIKKLLVAARECEAGYIARSLQGKLRIGLAQQTVNQALAHAVAMQSAAAADKSNTELADMLGAADETLKQTFSECPSYDDIVPALMEVGVENLPEKCKFRPGVPVKPMLAKPTCGVSEVLQRFCDVEFTCEYKYDGERAQIHLTPDGKVRVFSRNQEDNTSKFPDIVAALPRYLKSGVKSVVIDCEAVAYDRGEGKILPFQILSTRGRKDIKEDDIKVQVALYAFDCLYLDGKPLLREPMHARRAALYSAFVEVPGEFHFVVEKTSRDVDELQTFLEESIAANTEGLIVKTTDATYEPSKRSLNWLKLKKDYMEGVGDSLDLVPIGAFHGRGKRTGVYGAYLLACYNPDDEEYQSICKIGTGFSEVQLEELSRSLEPHVMEVSRPYYKCGEFKPDVWLDAVQVWEVKAADLSISPVHQAAIGLVDPSKGIALRFPRFLRRREDKSPEQATSAEQVADFYNAQANKQEFNNGGGDDL